MKETIKKLDFRQMRGQRKENLLKFNTNDLACVTIFFIIVSIVKLFDITLRQIGNSRTYNLISSHNKRIKDGQFLYRLNKYFTVSINFNPGQPVAIQSNSSPALSRSFSLSLALNSSGIEIRDSLIYLGKSIGMISIAMIS